MPFQFFLVENEFSFKRITNIWRQIIFDRLFNMTNELNKYRKDLFEMRMS